MPEVVPESVKEAIVLVDIEGTTSAISFVHDVLFPYARAQLPTFVAEHGAEPEVRAILDAVAEREQLADDDAVVATLQRWIDEDRKETALKDLQGRIWEAGYRGGAYRAHLYDDAVEALRGWHDAGIDLHVYSSGSVHAQKLFFAHSSAGDVSGWFSAHFDTTVGGKREAESYRRIADALGAAPADVLFLSDVPEELDAAREAGMDTRWVIRENEGRFTLADAAGRGHVAVERLTDIELPAQPPGP